MTEKPYVGDVRRCNPERDRDIPLHDLIDFEIWDGARWVHALEAAHLTFPIEIKSS